MKKFVLLFALLAIGLSGCASSLDSAKKDCQAYGYIPGTSSYNGCVERTANATKARRSPSVGVGFDFMHLF